MIRAEKKTPNADAARTLIFGVIAAIVIIVGLDPAVKIWQRYFVSRPWIVSTIEIIPSREGKPDILYKAVARFPVKGTWTAFLQNAGGKRLCSGKGEGNYKPNDKDPQLWSWVGWLGTDCAEPTEPYQACAFYQVQSERGNWDTTDPVCSGLYDPLARKTLK